MSDIFLSRNQTKFDAEKFPRNKIGIDLTVNKFNCLSFTGNINTPIFVSKTLDTANVCDGEDLANIELGGTVLKKNF